RPARQAQDYARPEAGYVRPWGFLCARGREAAPKMGAYMARHALVPAERAPAFPPRVMPGRRRSGPAPEHGAPCRRPSWALLRGRVRSAGGRGRALRARTSRILRGATASGGAWAIFRFGDDYAA